MADQKTDIDDEQGFARRWSRLKQESQTGGSVPAESDDRVAAEDAEAPVEEIDPADLPDINTLDAESDFTPFMQKGVPDDIKNLALRKLWRTNPVFANLDGLNEYDEDFAAALKAGEVFMEQLAEAAKKAAEEGIDGPKYPTATYADPEDDAEDMDDDGDDDEGDHGDDNEELSPNEDRGSIETALERDDSDGKRA